MGSKLHDFWHNNEIQDGEWDSVELPTQGRKFFPVKLLEYVGNYEQLFLLLESKLLV